MWIAGLTVCLLATLGTIAIVRSIPASYASIPDEAALSKLVAAPSGSEDAQVMDAQADFTLLRAAINRRNQARCSECGVIESMRQIERPGDVGRHDIVNVTRASGVSGSASGSAIAANSITGMGYAFTIRFRDGSTTVINQASPEAWRLGTRVIVVGRSTASNN
jgi:hypothetical protein